MEWNEEPMDGAGQGAVPPPAPGQPAPPRRGPRPVIRQQGGPQVFGSIVDYGRLAAGVGAAAQGAHLGNMIGQTMDAIGQENRSRVAQEREMRRMEHEKALKQMELDAMLARLRIARN